MILASLIVSALLFVTAVASNSLEIKQYGLRRKRRDAGANYDMPQKSDPMLIAHRLARAGLTGLLAMAFVVDAGAQSASAPATVPALSLVALGSGGPGATGRAGSSYLVLVDGTPRILVDAGPGSFARLGEAKLSLANCPACSRPGPCRAMGRSRSRCSDRTGARALETMRAFRRRLVSSICFSGRRVRSAICATSRLR